MSDTQSVPISSFTGRGLPNAVDVASSVVTVEFVSDETESFDGFELRLAFFLVPFFLVPFHARFVPYLVRGATSRPAS